MFFLDKKLKLIISRDIKEIKQISHDIVSYDEELILAKLNIDINGLCKVEKYFIKQLNSNSKFLVFTKNKNNEFTLSEEIILNEDINEANINANSIDTLRKIDLKDELLEKTYKIEYNDQRIVKIKCNESDQNYFDYVSNIENIQIPDYLVDFINNTISTKEYVESQILVKEIDNESYAIVPCIIND